MRKWLLWMTMVWASACATVPPPKAAAPAPVRTEWRDSVVYFAIVDRFADGDPSNDANVDIHAKGTFHGGDLKGLTAHIDDIASLGVTALWITPVVKQIPGFVTGAGFPDWAYHGYWADDFFSLDPRFGTEADLKALVDACHARGIKVLLDVVYNHAGYNSHYLTDPKTKNWLRSEERGTCGHDDLTLCVGGLPDWKTELPEVDEFLLPAHIDLAKRVGLDGFRLDTVKHVQHEFWQEHRRRTRAQLGKDFFLLGEVWGGEAQSLDPWFANDEMDAGFDFSFQGSAIGWIQGRGRTISFDRYLKSREKVRPGYLLTQFLSSHDVTGALQQLEGNLDQFRLAAILEFTTIGMPMIYYGEEVARPGGAWPDNRSDMPWGTRDIKPGAGLPRDEKLRDDYRRLIAIRRAHPALSRGVHTALSTEGDVLVFSQRDAASGDEVIVAMNRGESEGNITVQLPVEWKGSVTDAWGGGHMAATGGALQTVVGPRKALILVAAGAR